MASQISHKSKHNEECSSENGVGNYDVIRKQWAGIKDNDSSIEQLRREFHRSLDLNYSIFSSASIELYNPSHVCYDANIQVGQLKAKGGEEESTNVDLSLSLAPPGQQRPPKDDDQSSNSNPIHHSSSETSSSSQRSCMSLDLNLIDDTESTNAAPHQLPSLLLMGCTHCYMYVMVSEADPKCPKCQSSILIDIFREKPAKRPRIN